MNLFYLEDVHVRTMVKIKNLIKATRLSFALSSASTAAVIEEQNNINSLYDEIIKKINKQINKLIEAKRMYIKQLGYANSLKVQESNHSSTKTLQSIFIDDDFDNKTFLYKNDKPLILEDLYFHLNVEKIEKKILRLASFNFSRYKRLLLKEIENYPTLGWTLFNYKFFIYPLKRSFCGGTFDDSMSINVFAANRTFIKRALSIYNDASKFLCNLANLHQSFLNFSFILRRKFNHKKNYFMVTFSPSEELNLEKGIYGTLHQYTDADFALIKQAVKKVQLQYLYHVGLEPLIINRWIYSIRYDFNGYKLFVIRFLSKPIFIVTDENNTKLPVRKMRKVLKGMNYKSVVQEINDRFYSNEDFKKRLFKDYLSASQTNGKEK